jgi:P27 family predicted phage terminase small subunit
MENEWIYKEKAQELLKIGSYMQLRRYANRYNIETKSLGKGKPTVYKYSDVMRAFTEAEDAKRFAPKTATKKRISKEIVEREHEEKKEESKQEIKKEHSDEKLFSPIGAIGTAEKLRVEELLAELGTIHNVDNSIVLAYAMAYERYMYYSSLAHKIDSVEYDPSGAMKVSPYHTISKDHFKQMESLAKILGIGARSRIGLVIEEEKEINPFQKLMEDE